MDQANNIEQAKAEGVPPAGRAARGRRVPSRDALQKNLIEPKPHFEPDPLDDLLGDPINLSPPPPATGPTISEADLADLLGLTSNRVRVLTRDGLLKRVAPATYNQRDAVRAYCDNLRTLAARAGRQATPEGEALKAEKLRLAKHQADKIELQNAQLRRELLPAAEVERTWSEMLRDVRAALLAVGTRCGAVLPHLSAHDVQTIDREIKTALEGLADGN